MADEAAHAVLTDPYLVPGDGEAADEGARDEAADAGAQSILAFLEFVHPDNTHM